MNIPEATHPFWGAVTFIGGFIALVVLMFFNSTQFDETELKVLSGYLIAGAGLGAVRTWAAIKQSR